MSRETRARRVPAAISDEETRSPTPRLDLTQGIDAPKEPPDEEYSKKLLKIREDHKTDMRLYKKDIHKCVFDDDEDHSLFLQRMPGNPADIQYKASCGYMYCTAANGVFEPGAYRVSIETKEQPEAKGSHDRSIPLEPLHKWSGALAKYPSGVKRRGKGKDVKHWLCLACFEDLWMETAGFAEEGKDKYDLPYIQDLAVLQPENRRQGRHDTAYHLSSPQAYALEKWCAVMRFDHPYIEWDQAGCIPGLEPGYVSLGFPFSLTQYKNQVECHDGCLLPIRFLQSNAYLQRDMLTSKYIALCTEMTNRAICVG